MNLPNLLTTLRFLLIPVFIAFFYSSSENAIRWAIYIFIAAGITDVLDGYIARKYNKVTKWGQAMDPLADKLMQITALACFTQQKYIPIWVITLIGVKELVMIIGAFVLYLQKDKLVVPANRYGKISTVVFYFALIAVAFSLPYAMIFMAMAVAVTFVALIKYSLGFKKVHDKNFSE